MMARPIASICFCPPDSEPAGDSHFIFSAGKLSSTRSRCSCVEAAAPGREQHILAHRQLAEDAHILRHVSDAEPGDVRRVQRGDRLAVENDLAESRLPQAHDGAQSRGLAGAVAAEQRGDASAPDGEIDAMQNAIAADVGKNAVEPQQGVVGVGHCAGPAPQFAGAVNAEIGLLHYPAAPRPPPAGRRRSASHPAER